MSRAPENRLLRAVRALVEDMLAPTAYLGLYEYRVIGGSGALGFELQAVNKSSGMPDLQRVNIYAAGPADAGVTLVPGATVLVGFVNGSPQRPFLAHDGAIVRHGDIITFPTPGPAPIVKAPAP